MGWIMNHYKVFVGSLISVLLVTMLSLFLGLPIAIFNFIRDFYTGYVTDQAATYTSISLMVFGLIFIVMFITMIRLPRVIEKHYMGQVEIERVVIASKEKEFETLKKKFEERE